MIVDLSARVRQDRSVCFVPRDLRSQDIDVLFQTGAPLLGDLTKHADGSPLPTPALDPVAQSRIIKRFTQFVQSDLPATLERGVGRVFFT